MKYIKLYEKHEVPQHTVERWASGHKRRELWRLDNTLHREDGPARIEYFPDGRDQKSLEFWYLDGTLHRLDGPAKISYLRDGSIEWEEWWLNGQLHREDGPAWIWYHPDGSIDEEQWWLKDEQAEDVHSQEEFEAWQYLKSVGLL